MLCKIQQRNKFSVGKVTSFGLNETRNLPLNVNNSMANNSVNFYELASNLGKTQGSKAAKVIIDSKHTSYVMREKFDDILKGSKPRINSKMQDMSMRSQKISS